MFYFWISIAVSLLREFLIFVVMHAQCKCKGPRKKQPKIKAISQARSGH